MKEIPSATANMLVNTFAYISANYVLTEQSVNDVYKDDNGRLIKRIFTLTSSVLGGNVLTNFKLTETGPQRTFERMNIDFVDNVYIDSDMLYITSGDLMISFAIETEE